jgi:hypothetical protein
MISESARAGDPAIREDPLEILRMIVHEIDGHPVEAVMFPRRTVAVVLTGGWPEAGGRYGVHWATWTGLVWDLQAPVRRETFGDAFAVMMQRGRT